MLTSSEEEFLIQLIENTIYRIACSVHKLGLGDHAHTGNF